MNATPKAVLLALALPLVAQAAEKGQRLDAEVTTSAGKKTNLKAYYGKPVLLFYEDPNSVKVNLAAKEKLGKLSLKWNLKEKVEVVAVANLEGLNWQPALMFALMIVRSEEKKARIPVLVDFTGSMEKAPWKLDASQSTVLVLAPDGEVLFQSKGLLEGKKYDELIATLTRLLEQSTVSDSASGAGDRRPVIGPRADEFAPRPGPPAPRTALRPAGPLDRTSGVCTGFVLWSRSTEFMSWLNGWG